MMLARRLLSLITCHRAHIQQFLKKSFKRVFCPALSPKPVQQTLSNLSTKLEHTRNLNSQPEHKLNAQTKHEYGSFKQNKLRTAFLRNK